MNQISEAGPEDPLEVLLVEDTLEDALLIRTLLEDQLGCRVTLAQDGIRGCQLAENQQWDVVVTDLNLPGRSGTEVIWTSKNTFPDTPILAITAYSEGIGDALKSGADEILRKPLERGRILERVSAMGRGVRAAEGGDGDEDERRVLAIGGLPGDVEVGCGGILLGQRAFDHAVTILVTCAGGDPEGADARREEAERAAERLGADLVVPEPFGSEIPSQERVSAWVGEAIERVEPHILYTPSDSDVRRSRTGVHEAAVALGGGIRRHYAYQAPTSTLDFRPTLFVDIGEHLQEKLEILSEFHTGPDFRPHLQASAVEATAEYWGRFLGYTVAEPLEVVRKDGD